MPRAYVLGNGNIFAAFDEFLQLRDFHYPHVGMEDHTHDGRAHRLGFFADGWFSWLSDKSWQITYDYHQNALISNALADHSFLRLSVRFEDYVHPRRDVLFRRLTITNQADYARVIKVFFHHDFNISGTKNKDTAQFEPRMNAVLHYRGYRYFLVNGQWDNGAGLKYYTVGKSNYNGKEGTFRDAEDGFLQGNPIDQGSVDSTVGFAEQFQPHESKTFCLWLIAGEKYGDILRENEYILKTGTEKIFRLTSDYWRKQLPAVQDFGDLPQPVIDLYQKSLGVIRAHIDNGGAILAANDSDIMRSNRDNYSYMWPRDGAFVAMTMCKVGHPEFIRGFFRFCAKALTHEGFLLSKYNSDGSVGSSWHPKIVNGEIRSQIQEDETALVMVALLEYLRLTGDHEFVKKLYSDLIHPAALFLANYIDEKTGLPRASYDLWEQDWGHSIYTVSCTFAGLSAAIELSKLLNESAFAEELTPNTERMREAILKSFYIDDEQRFTSRIELKEGIVTQKSLAADMSTVFLWKCGLISADDPRVVQTMEKLFETLAIRSPIGGYARMENDFYHFDSHLSHYQFPGNPWIITTLWKADFEIETAKNLDDLKKVIPIFEWANSRANSAGILPEQIHPLSGAPLAVAPLTWSHATYVSSILRYLERRNELSH